LALAWVREGTSLGARSTPNVGPGRMGAIAMASFIRCGFSAMPGSSSFRIRHHLQLCRQNKVPAELKSRFVVGYAASQRLFEREQQHPARLMCCTPTAELHNAGLLAGRRVYEKGRWLFGEGTSRLSSPAAGCSVCAFGRASPTRMRVWLVVKMLRLGDSGLW
jgi:hypothetical protein